MLSPSPVCQTARRSVEVFEQGSRAGFSGRIVGVRLPPDIESALERKGHRWTRVQPLAGDVSQRRYLRLLDGDGRPRLLALYPEDLRDSCRRFQLTTELLTEAGVRVPAILDADCGAGASAHRGRRGAPWMLVEDLGIETLYERFADERDPWPALRPHYLAAVSILRRIVGIPAERVASLNPPLGRALLLHELDQTWEVFFEPRGLRREHGTGRRLDEILVTLCRDLDSPGSQREGPHRDLVPCHRDFMARNLVPLDAPGTSEGDGENGSLGVLDHQDLRLGPRFYDLASLLNDSLFPPPELEKELLDELASSAADVAVYRRAAVQRTLKAIGTYARHHRHEELIRPTFERALDHLEKLPGDAELAAELRAAEIC